MGSTREEGQDIQQHKRDFLNREHGPYREHGPPNRSIKWDKKYRTGWIEKIKNWLGLKNG